MSPASPAASPSYQAVESQSFDVAIGGAEPSYFLRLANDEVAELVDDDVAFAAAGRLNDLAFSPEPVGRAAEQRARAFARLGNGWRAAKIDDLMQPPMTTRLIEMQKTIAAGAPFGRSWSVFDGIDRLMTLVVQSRRERCLPTRSWMLEWMAAMREAISAAGVTRKARTRRPAFLQCDVGTGRINYAGVSFDMAADMDPYYQLGVQMNELYQFESQ